jgi:hypothetical protein
LTSLKVEEMCTEGLGSTESILWEHLVDKSEGGDGAHGVQIEARKLHVV